MADHVVNDVIAFATRRSLMEVVDSAFVEEAGKWVIFPGEAPNMLLQLLHANDWFGNHKHVRVGAVRQNGQYSCSQCENQCEQNCCAKERYLPAKDANSVANGFLHRQRDGGIEVVT